MTLRLLRTLFSLFLLFSIIACEDSDDPDTPSTDPATSDSFPERKNQDLQGTIYGKNWKAEALKINFDDNTTQNGPYSTQVTFFDTLSIYPCTQNFSIPFNRRSYLNINPQMGWQRLDPFEFNIPFDTTYNGYWSLTDNDRLYVYVDELDTTGIGYISAYLYYESRKFPPPIQIPAPTTGGELIKLEGYFNGSFCRTAKRIEYKDQPLQGIFDGQSWTMATGKCSGWFGGGATLDLVGIQQDLQCDSLPRFPNLEIPLWPDFEEKVYSSTILQPLNQFFMARKGFSSRKVLDGAISIEEIDTVNKVVKGKADLFGLYDPYYFNGSFEVPYCQ